MSSLSLTGGKGGGGELGSENRICHISYSLDSLMLKRGLYGRSYRGAL